MAEKPKKLKYRTLKQSDQVEAKQLNQWNNLKKSINTLKKINKQILNRWIPEII